jgi:hypothetical protein
MEILNFKQVLSEMAARGIRGVLLFQVVIYVRRHIN